MTVLLLTPGASATRDSSALVAIEDAVVPDGVQVVRIDLPNRAPKAVDVVVDAATELGDHVVLGGRSFGGRMCSVAVAEGRVPAAVGLALVSYPLHPPGKPAQLRTEHFATISVPCLFVSGTRDTFGTPEELEAATAAIPTDVKHVWVDGGDHGLRGRDGEVAGAVRGWLSALTG